MYCSSQFTLFRDICCNFCKILEKPRMKRSRHFTDPDNQRRFEFEENGNLNHQRQHSWHGNQYQQYNHQAFYAAHHYNNHHYEQQPAYKQQKYITINSQNNGNIFAIPPPPPRPRPPPPPPPPVWNAPTNHHHKPNEYWQNGMQWQWHSTHHLPPPSRNPNIQDNLPAKRNAISSDRSKMNKYDNKSAKIDQYQQRRGEHRSSSHYRRERDDIDEKLHLRKVEKHPRREEEPRMRRGKKEKSPVERERTRRLSGNNRVHDGDGRVNVVPHKHRQFNGDAINQRNDAPKRMQNNHIPDRWSKYTIGIGSTLEGTRFLPFKCPLHPEFFVNKSVDIIQFNVDTILSHVAALNGRLGIVIDLTATNRYYDGRIWEHNQIEYEKHSCQGHSVNTNEHVYARFARTVKRFIADNAKNDKWIGVHCTHGLNRTGFLICRFLIQELGWDAQRAMQAFATARGYPMERQPYIQTLCQIEQNRLHHNNNRRMGNAHHHHHNHN